MTYQAVLFDMDGVIVDSEPLHVAAFHAVLKEYGHDLTDAHYKEHFAGRTDEAGFRQYFDFVGENVDVPVILGKKAAAYLALAADQLRAYPGVVACIRDLARRGVPLALVTGSLRREADIVLDTFGISDAFRTVIAAEDIVNSKPDPEGYLKAAAELGVSPARCLVVEDAPKGVEAARAAGMRCIAVTNTHVREELADADVIVTSLLPGMLERSGI